MPTKKPQKSTIKKSTLITICIIAGVIIAALITLIIVLATKDNTPPEPTAAELEEIQIKARDKQRRNDLDNAITAVTNFQKNNRGRIPTFEETGVNSWGNCGRSAYSSGKTTPDGFCNRYLQADGSTFADPDGTIYAFKSASDANGQTQGNEKLRFDHNIYVYEESTCDGENAIPATGARKIALRYKLEGKGTICVNN